MTIKTANPPRKPKDPERTRADILQAALDVFARRGFEAATVRDIAAQIGMSHGMIRYHYETKEKLWFAAVDFLFERLYSTVSISPENQARLEAGDIEVLRDWLREYVRYCARHPEHARIMIQESVSPSERLREAMHRHVRDNHKAVLKTIAVMKDKGALPTSVHPISFIYMLAGACQNMFALAPEVHYVLDYDALSEQAIEAHADSIVALFCPA
ncbi:MAG: TetR/AcrR family transcriptional regulator [Pseudomonadota bacterium]